MPRQIQGSQWDFSFGEVDADFKRADDHPARKGGLRQMLNARIHNSRALNDRPGRRALYPVTNGGVRTERFIISSGNVFDIQFAAGGLKIINSAGVTVANFTVQGNGAALPWASKADINSIVYAPFNLSVYITFGHAMRPQVLTWDGVATWTIADYTELLYGGQKRTWFYRISPQGITLIPGARSGSGVSLVASAPVFTAAHVNTRMRFVNRQVLITAVASSTSATVTIEETLPGQQDLGIATDPRAIFSLGDVITGETSGSKGLITSINSTTVSVQLLSTNTTVVTISVFDQRTVAFVTGETIVGPAGSMPVGSAGAIITPNVGVAIWDEEVMNALQGYPASCFVDQFRLGFCNFKSVPGGIGWSAINSPTDIYVGPNPNDALFELAPRKVQVYHVVAGPEGNEFVFCDRALFYIPISVTNPLKTGSVAFNLLSGDGCAQVQPRLAQEAIVYVNAGQNSVMAIIATGAFLRPFNTKGLSDFHAHLFNNIQAIACPSADGTFNERYAYVLNGDGSIAVGKYSADSLAGNSPVIGWGPWSGVGVVSSIAAYAADVIFTSTYFGSGVVEILDDSQYLDCALAVNALPSAFAAPLGKGPLWFIPLQSVNLIDQVTRSMGVYQVDANGFIIPQFLGGEDLTRVDLVAGQPWTMVVEPFSPDASSGADVKQRMELRQISKIAVYVIHSSGLVIAQLFSAMQTATTPPLGTIMSERRFSSWNQGDDVTKPPTLRETVLSSPFPGSSYDPRAAIIKDTPGPLTICEIGMEISL